MVSRKKVMRWAGLPLVYGGVVVLAVSYATGLSRFNGVLLAGLIMVVGGAVGYMLNEKRSR